MSKNTQGSLPRVQHFRQCLSRWSGLPRVPKIVHLGKIWRRRCHPPFLKKTSSPSAILWEEICFLNKSASPRGKKFLFFNPLPWVQHSGKNFFLKKILFRECPYPGTRGRNSTIFIVKTSSPSAGRGTRGSHLFFFSFPCEQQIKSKVHNIQSSQVQYIKMTLWAAHGNWEGWDVPTCDSGDALGGDGPTCDAGDPPTWFDNTPECR
jgi:hypothetical protein